MAVGYSVGDPVDGDGPVLFPSVKLEVFNDIVHIVDIKSLEGDVLLVGGFAVHTSNDNVDGVFRLVGAR